MASYGTYLSCRKCPKVQWNSMESPASLLRQFVSLINAADVAGMTALMTEGHRFIDATGGVYPGRAQVTAGWMQYLQMFPNYRIEIESTVAEGDTAAGFGWVRVRFMERWRSPGDFRRRSGWWSGMGWWRNGASMPISNR